MWDRFIDSESSHLLGYIIENMTYTSLAVQFHNNKYLLLEYF